MKLIVGLGNPGKKYSKTRHNLGFIAIDFLAKKLNLSWREERDFNGKIAEGDGFFLLLPQTSMNASGYAVAEAARYYKIKSEEIAIVYDDLDLPLGRWRIRRAGASGGHRGVQSIIEQLADDGFWRFRLGIGSNREHRIDADKYVLAVISLAEMNKILPAIDEIEKRVIEWININ
ncbi:MAG: peptidyl-tRNA hydrolase [Candidatus Berkelbacteria bacterium Licking1014_2]|uniref:Peptidyl-tRNA hydrolase n=1 Tax=Candidatus Berkelbacteria bacterium Licking1014_2 TaxID=2017146 RepID=A0A554LW78_9BACT|nr:MAG: peptidyl-tRNA hydrolase [Candidatus Berkelbacteria bacterium Licking1014_2]